MSDEAFHYPPELTQLLVQTVPLLCRTKADVVLLFRGCGMAPADTCAVEQQLKASRSSISKYEISRTLLRQINEGGDRLLRARRELIRRVTQFEDFSSCWPDDQLKAKGLVAEIRRVVNVKDSFTRIAEERNRVVLESANAARERLEQQQQKKQKITQLRSSFMELFAERNPQRRGRALESVVNEIFAHFDISARKSFTRVEEPVGRVVEQIDGVVELDGHHYLVEMKWLSDPVSVDDVSRHLVRVYHREAARAIFVSDTEFSTGALSICRDALQHTTVILVTIEEIVRLLEDERDLKALLRKKIEAAVLDRQPWLKIIR